MLEAKGKRPEQHHPVTPVGRESGTGDRAALSACASLLQELACQLREAEVDHEAFETRLRPCDLAVCRATCCHDGVVLDREEAAMITGILQEGRLDRFREDAEAPAEWLSDNGDGRPRTATRPARVTELAEDFPAHFAATRCVFLDGGHKCLLQRLAMDEGRLPWFYKPAGCWMHPVALLAPADGRRRPLLTLRTPGRPVGPMTDFAACTHCGRPDRDGIPAADALEPELAFLSAVSGREFLRELRAPSAPGPSSAEAGARVMP